MGSIETGTIIRFEYIGEIIRKKVLEWAKKDKIDIAGINWKICDENTIEIHVTPQKIICIDAKESITEFIKTWTKTNNYNFNETTWKIFEPETDSLSKQTKVETGIEIQIHAQPQESTPETSFYT